MEKDTSYWIFSASAQSVSAFIAFLLTGYAIVLNMMQSAQQNDPTIEDLHESLKGKYYTNLLILAIICGISVILNLLGIRLNDTELKNEKLFNSIVYLFTFGAIVYGFIFIIIIIDPKKYRKAATQIIEKLKEGSEEIDVNQFFTEFVKLEKKLREYLQSHDLYIPDGRNIRMKYSVSQMVTALYKNNKIGFYAYDKLLTINKYRNAIFHGHTDKVSKYMMDDLLKLNEDLESYLKN